MDIQKIALDILKHAGGLSIEREGMMLNALTAEGVEKTFTVIKMHIAAYLLKLMFT